MFYLYSARQNKNVKTSKGKVIVFNTAEQAATFKQQFIQYAMLRIIRENFLGIGEVFATEQSMQIVELTAESGIKEEDTISFENL